jgi:hypothetical protein
MAYRKLRKEVKPFLLLLFIITNIISNVQSENGLDKITNKTDWLQQYLGSALDSNKSWHGETKKPVQKSSLQEC